LKIFSYITTLFCLIFVQNAALWAQSDSNKTFLPFPFKDESYSPLSTPAEGGLYMNTPSNIQSDVNYDPKTGKYVFEQKIGDKIPYRKPAAMSLDEYLEYDMEKSVKRFWQEKQAEELADKDGEDANKSKPLLKVENELLDQIFGEGGIEIKPQGSAEIILGVQGSRTKNPAIPLQNQRLTNLLFDQKIQLNVLGQLGDKMKINLNFNTEAMFSFENQTKLAYTGKEDEIIQLLEAGNVSMPLKTSLITGSQTLMGIKTGLKFGKLKVTTILAQQNGKKQEIEVKGGAQIKEFEVKADDYEYNQHFFLDHFFRNQYEKAVASPPILNNEIYITKVEVYKTPLNVFENTRNIVAFQDLGTAEQANFFNPGFVVDNSPAMTASNDANNLYALVSKNPNIRGFVTAVGELKKYGLQDRRDFFTISQSQMLIEGKDYTINRQLGYISLNSEIQADFALAVAFQYTYRGKTYQVGEFSTDGFTGTDPLMLKMIKSVELRCTCPYVGINDEKHL
jgi:cell surface protein SprA